MCILSCGVSKECISMSTIVAHNFYFVVTQYTVLKSMSGTVLTWPRGQSVLFFYLWNQVFIRFLYESCSELGNILHWCLILDVFIIKIWCVKFCKGILGPGKVGVFPRISNFNIHIFVHITLCEHVSTYIKSTNSDVSVN